MALKDKYREELSSQLKDLEGEIDKTVTTLIAAMLGFFLTINEKFIPYSESSLKLLMFLSVGFFFLAFSLSFYNKYVSARAIHDLIRTIDNSTDDNTLNKNIWKVYTSAETKSRRIKKMSYFFTLAALLLELTYFFYNIDKKANKDDDRIVDKKIEIVNLKLDSVTKVNDSIILYINRTTLKDGKKETTKN
jgi:hypothetical protein